MKNKNRNQEKLLKALEDTPLIETACRKIGIARSTYYRWCNDDRKYYHRSEAAKIKGREKLNDFVESKLLENIKNNQQSAIQFWLTNNSKTYRLGRATHIRRMAQIQDEELKRNQEILKIFIDDLEFKEAIKLLDGDPEIIDEVLAVAIKDKLRWLLEHDV